MNSIQAILSFSLLSLLSSEGFAQGSAADLDGLPSVGWPLGVPMHCQALTDAIAGSLDESIHKIREHCNDQNDQMRSAGFSACAKDRCLDNALQRVRGHDLGSLRLRLGQSEWTGQYYVSLTYTVQDLNSSNALRSSLVCFDPRERAEELLRDEFETWDFQKFVEFCIKKK